MPGVQTIIVPSTGASRFLEVAERCLAIDYTKSHEIAFFGALGATDKGH
jgi:hypothetical protein